MKQQSQLCGFKCFILLANISVYFFYDTKRTTVRVEKEKKEKKFLQKFYWILK